MVIVHRRNYLRVTKIEVHTTETWVLAVGIGNAGNQVSVVWSSIFVTLGSFLLWTITIFKDGNYLFELAIHSFIQTPRCPRQSKAPVAPPPFAPEAFGAGRCGGTGRGKLEWGYCGAKWITSQTIFFSGDDNHRPLGGQLFLSISAMQLWKSFCGWNSCPSQLQVNVVEIIQSLSFRFANLA